MNPARLAVVSDFPEEAWPSMDLVAEMLLAHLPHAAGGSRAPMTARRLCPPFRRRVGRTPVFGTKPAAHNADRLLNRFWDYPSHLRNRRGAFDAFHVCDHSYAHLVHVLPARRTGVFCHDLDAFAAVLDPGSRRPVWFRAMTRQILRGLQKAAVVFCATDELRRKIEGHSLVDPVRIVRTVYGVSSEYSPEPTAADERIDADARPFLLHVGSCIPRKRIDVLLDVFAAVRQRRSSLRLVQIGGRWTAVQSEQIRRLGLEDAVIQLRNLDRSAIAAHYRRAAVVLQPSESEGFGLPVIEALACGAAVVASDIPVLREVGGDAVAHCPTADVPAWAETIERLLYDPAAAPQMHRRLKQASRYSWAAHAKTVVETYRRLLSLP